MKNFKFLLTVLTIILIFGACSKDVPCTNCACFNFVEPLRFTYLNSANEDLIGNESVIIDSIVGTPLIGGIISEEYSLINYEKKNSVIKGSPTEHFFYELDLDQFAFMGETELIGTDVNHLCFVHRNNTIVDTLEFKWSFKVTKGVTCCTCTSFPYDYIKYNGYILSEGTDAGAAIIRL